MESKDYDDRSVDYKSGSKDEAGSSEEEDEVEREFKRLMNAPQEGEIKVSTDPQARLIAEGFRINWMNMRDANNGDMMWESGEWGETMWKKEIKARIPADILSCSAVSREINFSSVQAMNAFKLEQRIFYQGVCIEECLVRVFYV
ncbi:hypothetical protein TrCOL_g5397 [Triparma columacea]|uniref:GMP phosphodiesterase delta subunit domain-containing protein n=1 Tax=Triparma columacea TaxID=722753 RepID=A0A9W7GG10_9STRA|nr:hypothetical protein TrCOL_g5397 [Triparma columacea]